MSDDYSRKKRGGKIKAPKRKQVESDDDDELGVEDELEIERHDSDESEDEDEYDEEEYSDEDSDDDLRAKVKDVSNQFDEININVDSIAVDSRTKERLRNGYKSDILVFELQSNLKAMDPIIELRSDTFNVPSKEAKSVNARHTRVGHEISDIQSIHLVSVENTFPVSIAASINGLKDPNATTYRKNGAIAHIIASPSSQEHLSKPRLIMCPTKKRVDPFLEKHPDISIDKIESKLTETNGLCLIDKESPLVEFIRENMKSKKIQSVNDKLCAIESSVKTEAISEISKRLENKNICDIRDITLTISRAWPKEENEIAAFSDMKEIESGLPDNISSADVENIKSRATKQFGKINIKLEVFHRPLSSQ